MIIEWSSFLTIINLVLIIFAAVGGILAGRFGFAQTAQQAQERIINALNAENTLLLEQLKREKEAHTQDSTQWAARFAQAASMLKKSNMLILEYDQESVSITNNRTGKTHMSRVTVQQKENN